MAKKNFLKCEYCGRKIKKTNYLKHKAKVHPKQLSVTEKETVNASRKVNDKKPEETWSGLPGEVIKEVEKLRASTIEEHVEKAALLIWMKKTLCKDPYWIKPTAYIADDGYNAWFNIFKKTKQKYPSWMVDLKSGMPTYYGVLGVTRGASPEKIEQQYLLKREYSSYPLEVLDDARETLSDERSKKKYNSLLKTFNYLNKGLTKIERAGIIREHDSCIKHENSVMIMHYIDREHCGWEMAFMFGAPTFYEIAGIDGWKDGKLDGEKIKEAIETRKNLYPHAGELLEKIYEIFRNSILRWEYGFMVGFMEERMENGEIEEVGRMRDGWKKWDDKCSILVYVLNEPNAQQNFQRWEDIIQRHNDWERHLPPNTRSLYTLLGTDRNRVPSDMKKCSSFLRAHYRQCERTPEVNLAYTILKNKHLRKDYDWMWENHELMQQIRELFELGGGDPGEEKMMEMMFEAMAGRHPDDREE